MKIKYFEEATGNLKMSLKLSVQQSECTCQKCSSMCRAPCCGTPQDMELLIEAGLGSRLMLDILPGGEDMLKPALKRYEGQLAPWEVHSEEGCTFWKNGKCELHKLNLKPVQGKLTHHSLSKTQYEEIEDFIDESWSDDKANKVIQKWKRLAS